MVDIVTPSTGAVRPGGDFGLNVRRFAPGHRILARTPTAGWFIAEVSSVSETYVTAHHGEGSRPVTVTFREIAGTVAAGVDEDALIANLRAIEKSGDAGIQAARDAKRDALWVILECGDVERVAPFIPGM